MDNMLKKIVICLATFVVLYCVYRLFIGIISLVFHTTVGILSGLAFLATIVIAVLITIKITSR